MKKCVIALALAALILAFPVKCLAAPDCSAAACILMEPETGTVLYEKNADEPSCIASTTKIMTALVVLENCRLSDRVCVTEEAASVEGSSMYLAPGETLTVRELLYGLLLASGNDSAAALALHTAGSTERFCEMMNERAKLLGCDHTSYANPHGLDEDGHYSTARDLAVITAEAMKNPVFADIVATTSLTAGGREYTNHNRLLWEYDGACGVKTGFTSGAGRCLVSCAEREGMRLLCVTLNDPADWEDHASLYDWAFASWRCVTVEKGNKRFGPVIVISGKVSSVDTVTADRYLALVPRDAQVTFRIHQPRFVYAPVVSGESAGSVDVLIDGEPAGKITLLFGADCPLDRGAMLSGLRRFLRTLDLLVEDVI